MFENLIQKFNRFRARRALISRYLYLNEVDKLMEEYTTANLLEGGSEEFLKQGRKSLSENQGRQREQTKLIEFLRKVK